MKNEAEEKKRQEALRPDKEALALYLDALSLAINNIVVPPMKTTEGKTASVFIRASVEKIFADTLKKLEEM